MRRIAGFGAGFLIAAAGLAQVNTTSDTAAIVHWGQQVNSNLGSFTQFWFKLATVPGRSYCGEVGNLTGYPYADQSIDPILAIYHGDGTTLIDAQNDTVQEPFAGFLTRVCFIATARELARFRVSPNPGSPMPAATVTLRFVETTMFCPWFFVAGDYNAFSLIRNTSSSAIAGVVVTWRSLSGSAVGTTTVAIGGNGTVILNARDFVDPGIFSNGSIEIAHTGSPQQLTATTTTLSGTTGLGFDAPFTQRQPW